MLPTPCPPPLHTSHFVPESNTSTAMVHRHPAVTPHLPERHPSRVLRRHPRREFMKTRIRKIGVRAPFTIALLSAALAAPLAGAQSSPSVEARFVPDVLNMRTTNGLVSIVLSGETAGCTLSNVRLGTVAAVSLTPSANGAT